MKFFLTVFLGILSSVPAFCQNDIYKNVNAELRARFKLTSYETAFSGNTSSGANCDIFIKDNLYDPDQQTDELVITAQFEFGDAFQHLGLQLGPGTTDIRVSAANDKWTVTAVNNSWLSQNTETLTLVPSASQDFPDVTIYHEGVVGAPDYSNSCLGLRRN